MLKNLIRNITISLIVLFLTLICPTTISKVLAYDVDLTSAYTNFNYKWAGDSQDLTTQIQYVSNYFTSNYNVSILFTLSGDNGINHIFIGKKVDNSTSISWSTYGNGFIASNMTTYYGDWEYPYIGYSIYSKGQLLDIYNKILNNQPTNDWVSGSNSLALSSPLIIYSKSSYVLNNLVSGTVKLGDLSFASGDNIMTYLEYQQYISAPHIVSTTPVRNDNGTWDIAVLLSGEANLSYNNISSGSVYTFSEVSDYFLIPSQPSASTIIVDVYYNNEIVDTATIDLQSNNYDVTGVDIQTSNYSNNSLTFKAVVPLLNQSDYVCYKNVSGTTSTINCNEYITLNNLSGYVSIQVKKLGIEVAQRTYNFYNSNTVNVYFNSFYNTSKNTQDVTATIDNLYTNVFQSIPSSNFTNGYNTNNSYSAQGSSISLSSLGLSVGNSITFSYNVTSTSDNIATHGTILFYNGSTYISEISTNDTITGVQTITTTIPSGTTNIVLRVNRRDVLHTTNISIDSMTIKKLSPITNYSVSYSIDNGTSWNFIGNNITSYDFSFNQTTHLLIKVFNVSTSYGVFGYDAIFSTYNLNYNSNSSKNIYDLYNSQSINTSSISSLISSLWSFIFNTRVGNVIFFSFLGFSSLVVIRIFKRR